MGSHSEAVVQYTFKQTQYKKDTKRTKHRTILVLCSVFPTLPHKRKEFRKEFVEYTTVFRFSLRLCSETFLYEELGDIWSQMYTCLLVKYQPLLSDFNKTWLFSIDFRKIFKYQISWKSIQLEPSCSMRMGRRTHRHDEVNRNFRNFANAPKSPLGRLK